MLAHHSQSALCGRCVVSHLCASAHIALAPIKARVGNVCERGIEQIMRGKTAEFLPEAAAKLSPAYRFFEVFAISSKKALWDGI